MLEKHASLSVWNNGAVGTHFSGCWKVHPICCIERTRQLIWEACEQHWESGDFAVQSLIQLYKETTKDGESNALPRFG